MNALETVSAMLEIEGYDVAEAANGVDALQAIEGHPPDVILLDMRMPVMDGWGTAARDAAHWAAEIAASSFVAKPFGFDDLITAVERVAPAS